MKFLKFLSKSFHFKVIPYILTSSSSLKINHIKRERLFVFHRNEFFEKLSRFPPKIKVAFLHIDLVQKLKFILLVLKPLITFHSASKLILKRFKQRFRFIVQIFQTSYFSKTLNSIPLFWVQQQLSSRCFQNS